MPTRDRTLVDAAPVALPRLAPVVRDAALFSFLAGLIACFVLVAGPPGVDAAAHLYHTRAFEQHGWRIWDNYWYAGRYDLVNYSILYYPLAAALGQAVVAVGSVVGATALFATLAHRLGGRRPRTAIVAFACVWPTFLIAGQYPFGLGMVAALLSLLLWARGRPLGGLAAALAALLASPLAFLFLAIVLAGLAAAHRRHLASWRVRVAAAGIVLFGVAEVVVLRLFPSGGRFPYPMLDLFMLALFCGAGFLLARRSPRLEVLAAPLAAYLVAGAVVAAYPSGVGGNIARLAEYVALPTLLLLLSDLRYRPRLAALVVLGVAVVGHTVPVARDLEGGLAVRADEAEFWAGAVNFLQHPEHRDPRYRVAVVATWGHWESYHLASRDIPITRGWFRQDDFPVNSPLYSGDLDATSYQEWLRSLGVRYVVLPNEQLDYSSRREAEILRSPGHGGLVPVPTNDPNVQIFELPDPTPLLTAAAAPGLVPLGRGPTVTFLDRSSISMWLPAAGIYDLRVRFTPYWAPSDPDRTCLFAGDEGMTKVVAYQAGFVRLRFDLTLGESARQALGGAGGRCAAPPTVAAPLAS